MTTRYANALLLSAALLLPALSMPAQQRQLQPESVPLNWTSGPYSYDGSGNIVSIGPGTFGKIDVHVYDAFGRLVSTSANTLSYNNSQSIAYDRHGNITRVDTTSGPVGQGATTETTTPSVSAATNRLTNATCGTGAICPTGAYDEAGNQLTTGGGVAYSWDPLGMMNEVSAAGGRERYLYDSNGERIATIRLTAGGTPLGRDVSPRRLDGKVTRTFTDQIVANGHSWKWQEDYVYRGSLLLAAVRPDVSSGEKREHFQLDHLGTPRLITDDAGLRLAFHTYLPFGEEAPGSDFDSEAMKFTGHERSAPSSIAAGLDYMHARFYGGMAGRFLSVDPVLGKTDQPQSWNRYSYAMNGPIGRNDPDGKCFWDVCVGETAIVAVVATAVVGTAIAVHMANHGGRVDTHAIAQDIKKDVVIARAIGVAAALTVKAMVAHTPVIAHLSESKQDEKAPPPPSPATDDKAQQKGERATDGTAQTAEQQLEELEKQQNLIRTGKATGIIDTTGKSQQRMKNKHRKIKSSKDLDEYD